MLAIERSTNSVRTSYMCIETLNRGIVTCMHWFKSSRVHVSRSPNLESDVRIQLGAGGAPEGYKGDVLKPIAPLLRTDRSLES